MMKQAFYQHAKNLTLVVESGKNCLICNIQDQVLVLFSMVSIYTYLEDILAKVREAGS